MASSAGPGACFIKLQVQVQVVQVQVQGQNPFHKTTSLQVQVQVQEGDLQAIHKNFGFIKSVYKYKSFTLVNVPLGRFTRLRSWVNRLENREICTK